MTPLAPPSRKLSRKPMANSIAVGNTIAPFHIVPIQLMYLRPVGTAISSDIAEKNGLSTAPVANMWCAHTAIDSPAIASVDIAAGYPRALDLHDIPELKPGYRALVAGVCPTRAQANAVLDRLSGGQLYLRLCGEAGGEGMSSKALELDAYNRSTGDRPINVAFLSGSQKFRVAVSLALGIGQYASRQHRPIESVIIDEGFGCLDRESRPAMIQELQNLRSQLRCILLVSHQEEFAEAFADGYRFELADGATRVTRFQR